MLDNPIPTYLDLRYFSFIPKIINTRSPEYLFAKFQFFYSKRTMHLILPDRKYFASLRMFMQLRNYLPVGIRSINDIRKFALEIKSVFHTFITS